MLINNFITTIKADITLVADKIKGNNEVQNQKVMVAALRIFAALGMAFFVGYGVGAAASLFAGAAALSALSKVAVAVIGFVLSHDAFVQWKNLDQRIIPGFGVELQVALIREQSTRGTILEPLWKGINNMFRTITA